MTTALKGLISVHLADPALSAELSAIYTNIQKVLDLRHKYLRVSLQGNGDNPKDDPSWRVYPPPPPPVWIGEPARSAGLQDFNGPPIIENRRKPGENIGEDFVYDEVEVPGPDEMVFKLDDKGVFQVYENKKGIPPGEVWWCQY